MAHGGDFWHRGLAVPKGRFQETGRFGRRYPHLRSLKSFKAADAERLGAAKTGDDQPGPMNGGATPLPNPRLAAGVTFLGQFIDHDLTFDPTSHLEQQNDPLAIRNFRTPAFELDSVYGAGPKAQPYFYDGDLFAFSSDGVDHQRTARNQALIGDPRNDENLIISQLHLAFLKFHNAVRRNFAPDFEEAQTLVRWHYQWIVLNQFLRLICGDDAVDAALARVPTNTAFSTEAFMPVEFSVAAYRFAHSMVRAGYQINPSVRRAIFPADANDPPPTKDVRLDLRGGPVGPEFAVDWALFFGSGAQPSNRIDTLLSAPLLNLPMSVVDDAGLANQAANRSLAVRNLKRGMAFGLPSGEAIAGFLGVPPLTRAEVGEHSGMEEGTPLWFYILKEAEVRANGEHLAGVGARIVAEVFVELLAMDTASYLARDPGWTPTLPAQTPGTFTIEDLIALSAAPG